MERTIFWGIGFGAALLLAGCSPSEAPVTQELVDESTADVFTCEGLIDLQLPDTVITYAGEVAPGGFLEEATYMRENGPGRGGPGVFEALPAFCRVAGEVSPASDSQIKFEVWLPLEGWNGRFQGVGNGGLAGTISYRAMATALADGYVTGSTDTGHAAERGSANWALVEDKVIDFGYRAIHEMTVKSKAVAEKYFGTAPEYSYWVGCSEGGRQGMGEAQRYPDDYDGIVAGAPVIGFTRSQTKRMGTNAVLYDNPASFIPGSKYRMIHTAVMAQCDAIDGVEDGVITHPPACDFDPASLLCEAGDAADCLTAPQLTMLEQIYSGPINPRTGETIMEGRALGAELEYGERTDFSDEPPTFPLQTSTFYQYFVHQNPDWNDSEFDLDADFAYAYDMWGETMDNFNPDLSGFRESGGKLIHYHGWNDAQPSPYNSISYYDSVQEELGNTDDFYRLFMIPGMGHCGGGPATDRWDRLAEIRAWVEEGKAPDSIYAEHHEAGEVTKSRPLCPHPQIAKYTGEGSTDEAASFVCGMP